MVVWAERVLPGIFIIKNWLILGTCIAFGVALAAEILTLPRVHVELDAHVAPQVVLAYEEEAVPVPPVAVPTRSATEARVRQYFADMPVMAEIAWCESHYTQYDPGTGQVIRGVVNSADVGVMQINERYHATAAQSLGMDLHTLEGNLAYARYLYNREGTRPWRASMACWQSSELALR